MVPPLSSDGIYEGDRVCLPVVRQPGIVRHRETLIQHIRVIYPVSPERAFPQRNVELFYNYASKLATFPCYNLRKGGKQ